MMIFLPRFRCDYRRDTADIDIATMRYLIKARANFEHALSICGYRRLPPPPQKYMARRMKFMKRSASARPCKK